VGFGDSNDLDPATRVKVMVYHVKERMTGTVSIFIIIMITTILKVTQMFYNFIHIYNLYNFDFIWIFSYSHLSSPKH